jgi:hypothetical protein
VHEWCLGCNRCEGHCECRQLNADIAPVQRPRPGQPFAAAVAAELSKARSRHGNIHSAHEGYAVILEELDEFKKEVCKRREKRDPDNMLRELIQVAAMAQRAAEDLDLIR